MSSIFTDKQRDSLMESMINPESNARKMIEQNQEIGISPDITTEILNKYATYGANTGIGELGGGKLVDALNEEYRKEVDAPLREMSEKASVGRPPGGNYPDEIQEQLDRIYIGDPTGGAEILTPSGSAERALTKTQLLQSGGFDAAEELAQTGEGAKLMEVNSPVVMESGSDPVIDAVLEESAADKAAKEKAIASIATTVGNILAQEIFNPIDEDPDPIIRAVKPKPFKTNQIRAHRIGMQDGGSTVLNRKMFIGGGEVDGPGGPKEDLVPIWASDKEYVVSHEGVKRMGGGDFDKGIAALDRINFGK